MNDLNAHVDLSVVRGSDPICGEAAIDAELPQPFTGWMELVELIESARCREAAEAAFVVPAGPVQ